MKSLHKRITTLQGEYVQNFERTRVRLFAVVTFFALAFLIVGFRLIILMGPNAFHTTTPKASEILSSTEAAPRRVNITDANGIILATSLATRSLYADPKYVNDAALLARELTEVFPDLDYDELYADLRKDRRFIWVKRHLTPKEQAKVLKIGDPALALQTEYRRVYPQGSLTAHIIGFTNTDGTGIAGIEKEYEKALLKGGSDLQLTIDTRLQDLLKTEILKSVREYKAIGGSGIVMDARNGEVLAMVSLPDFDPHRYNTASDNARFNRNTVGVYEMGSTFKVFSTAAALENKTAYLSDMYDVSEPLKSSRFTIRDFHMIDEPVSLTEVFIHSSNIGTALMAEELGAEKLQNFYRDLGFFSRAEIDIPERGMPITPGRWRDITTLTASYGHGIAVSPMHVVRATAAMVNGGTLPDPHFVKIKGTHEKPQLSIISPQTSANLRGLMTLAVEEGTGSRVKQDHIWVGGKTGTAEKVTSRGYTEDKLFSSFVGVFPSNEPRYVVLVAIDEPKGTKDSFGYATGGWTSAPVVSRVIEYMAPMMEETRHLTKTDFPELDALRQYIKEDEDHAAF